MKRSKSVVTVATMRQHYQDQLSINDTLRAANAELVAALEALLPDAKEPWGMRARALLARIKA